MAMRKQTKVERTGENKMSKTVCYHKWESTTEFVAPYRHTGAIISLPSPEAHPTAYQNGMRNASEEAAAFGVRLGSCQVCGNGIMNNHVAKDAEGAYFVIGCDCAQKLGGEMCDEAKKAEKIRQAKIREEKREKARLARVAKHQAELQEQRDRNGGLTDREVEAERIAEERRQKRAKLSEKNEWLIEVLQSQNGGFCADMAITLETNEISDLSPRQIGALQDVYAKSHGRRNSKAYKAAEQDFEARVK